MKIPQSLLLDKNALLLDNLLLKLLFNQFLCKDTLPKPYYNFSLRSASCFFNSVENFDKLRARLSMFDRAIFYHIRFHIEKLAYEV